MALFAVLPAAAWADGDAFSSTQEASVLFIAAGDEHGNGALGATGSLKVDGRLDFEKGEFYSSLSARMDLNPLEEDPETEFILQEARFRFFPADELTLVSGLRKVSWGYALGDQVGGGFPPIAATGAAASAEASRQAAVPWAALDSPFGALSPAATLSATSERSSLGAGVTWRPLGPDFGVDASVDASQALYDATLGNDFQLADLAYALVLSGTLGSRGTEWYAAGSWAKELRARAEAGARTTLGPLVLRVETLMDAYRCDHGSLDWKNPGGALRGGVETLFSLGETSFWAATELLWMPEPEAFYGNLGDLTPSPWSLILALSAETVSGLGIEARAAVDPVQAVMLGNLEGKIPVGGACELSAAVAGRLGEGGPLAASTSTWAASMSATIRH